MAAKPNYIRPLDLKKGFVDMPFGAGGRATAQLISEVFASAFKNEYLEQGHDGALMPAVKGRLVTACDGHVVNPLIFPGGDIGRLAVSGTVNDVAVCGAKPLYLTASFILEEGLPLATLKTVVDSMAATAKEAGVLIVTGDTKVVERGHGDGIYIATTGIGEAYPDVYISGQNAKPGDAVLVTGTMGDHGLTILSKREGLTFDNDLESDCAPLADITSALVETLGTRVHVLRDPTRGGLATTLNEIASQSQVGIELDEAAIPIKEAVQSGCEFLGLDPLYVANEGKLIVIVEEAVKDDALEIIRANAKGRDAACVGRVTSAHPAEVRMQTLLGGHRLVDWLNSDPLPRIC